MSLKRILYVLLGAAVFGLTGFGIWLLSLPPAPGAFAAPPVPEREAQAALAALKPPKRARPLIAVVGINDATEVTDYLITFGILHRADVADVVLLATDPGPVQLYPALRVQPHATVSEFDAQHPDGADYVIVPAMSRDDDPAALAWIRSQAAAGATIIGVCAGAKVVTAAGLLDGRRATTHWYYVDEMLDESPEVTYVADRRIVVDGSVATTTGITASMPMMLTLIEAMGGRERAEAVARDLGMTGWDSRHDSDAFKLTRPFALTVLGNVLAFWSRDEVRIELEPGLDEVSLALVADAWSRTYRSRAVTFAESSDAVETRSGVRIVPDESGVSRESIETLAAPAGQEPVDALIDALLAIQRRYGPRTAALVAMQLEYPRSRLLNQERP